jgi:hypothetical protein
MNSVNTICEYVSLHRTIQEPGSHIVSWYKPPQSVLIIKKLWDDSVDQSFVELATWLVEVTCQIVIFGHCEMCH